LAGLFFVKLKKKQTFLFIAFPGPDDISVRGLFLATFGVFSNLKV